MHAKKSILFKSRAEMGAWHGAKGGGTSVDQFQVDNGSERGAVCQNGTLEALLDATATPPFQLPTPTVPPPCPLPTLCIPMYWPFVCHFGTVRPVQGTRTQAWFGGGQWQLFRLTLRHSKGCGCRRVGCGRHEVGGANGCAGESAEGGSSHWISTVKAPLLRNCQYFLIKVSWTGVHVFGHNRSIEIGRAHV